VAMEARKVRDADDARWCLSAVAASGMPRAAWARSPGVDARSLNAWRLTLERRSERGPTRFVELVPRVSARSPVYRVRCGDFIVETETDFDDESLLRLLRLVAACCRCRGRCGSSSAWIRWTCAGPSMRWPARRVGSR
jgi:hypothetical protein